MPMSRLEPAVTMRNARSKPLCSRGAGLLLMSIPQIAPSPVIARGLAGKHRWNIGKKRIDFAAAMARRARCSNELAKRFASATHETYGLSQTKIREDASVEKIDNFRQPARAMIVFTLLAGMLGEASAQTASNVPQIFAPGVISGPASERAPAFSPDGATVYFMRGNVAQSAIMLSHRIGKEWSEPQVAPFSGIWRDI